MTSMASLLAAVGSGGLVGFTLGLIGGGGSILATPLLLYVVGVANPHVAIGTGALAVSVNAYANFIAHARQKHVWWRCAIIFAAMGTFGALLGSTLGLIVDGIFDTQEIVVKPLGKRLKGLCSYLGATIMGDGHVALILDIPGLAHLAGMASQTREARKLDTTGTASTETRESFLIFRAGAFNRVAVPLTMVSRLEQIEARSIEHAAGHPVLHYRGQILTLIDLSFLLDPAAPRVERSPSTTTQVIVLGQGERRLGILVDQIVDIVEEAINFRTSTMRKGLCGSVILGITVTDLLDAEGLLSQANHPSLADAADEYHNTTLKRIA